MKSRPKIIEILEDLFFVQRGYLNSNHFVYRSDSPILIDTGYKTDFNTTESILTSLGVSTDNVSKIISTHCHCDHIGGNAIIQEHSNCEILIHETGKYFIETGDDWSTWWRYFCQDADFFSCTTGLKDSDIVDVGPHSFLVIHTPGHAADGIVLYNRENRILISSDTLWEDDVAVITPRIEGSTAVFSMKRSLEKIADLNVDTVYPGHGSPFKNFKNALSKSLEKMDEYIRDREKIGKDLLKKITIYTLLMKPMTHEDAFFNMLMKSTWFRETVDLYFDGQYRQMYDSILKNFKKRGIIRMKNSALYTTVKP